MVAVMGILQIRFDGAWAAIAAEAKTKAITTTSDATGKCHATPK